MGLRVGLNAWISRCQLWYWSLIVLTFSLDWYPANDIHLTKQAGKGTIKLYASLISLSFFIKIVTKGRGPTCRGLSLPERDGHDEKRNAAIVAALPLACGDDPSKLRPHRSESLAAMIGPALAGFPIDCVAAVDSSLPAFHADPHRGPRTMEVATHC